MSAESLALVVATLQRPHAIQRLINSVRTYYPDMAIYVADQSQPTQAMRDYYSSQDCTVVWMGHDAGVCASRNAAVDLVKEPFFVLCDDDFFFDAETRFDAAVAIFNERPDVGVVGGRLYDRYHTPRGMGKDNRHWELLFSYDQKKGKLCTIPIHYFAPEPEYAGNTEYFECDAVMNFAVFRTEMFDDVVRWDPRFKSNGEHEDFYLNLKVNGRHRVVYTRDIVAHHHHPHQSNYSKFRNRSNGWQRFLDKWGLRQFLEMDGGLRVTNQVGQILPYAVGYEKHYRGIPLDTRERHVRAGESLISNVTGRLIRQGAYVATSCNVQIDLEGRGKVCGGRWQFKADVSSKSPDQAEGKRIRDWSTVEFRSSFPDAHTESSDIFCFVYPALSDDGEPRGVKLEGLEVYYSVATGSEYVAFMKPALIFEQHIHANQWNAVSINIPPLTCDLVIELSLFGDGELVYSSPHCVSYRNPSSPVPVVETLGC